MDTLYENVGTIAEWKHESLGRTMVVERGTIEWSNGKVYDTITINQGARDINNSGTILNSDDTYALVPIEQAITFEGRSKGWYKGDPEEYGHIRTDADGTPVYPDGDGMASDNPVVVPVWIGSR